MIIKNSKNNNMNQNHEMTYKTILPQERVIIDEQFSKYPIEIYWTKENLFTPYVAIKINSVIGKFEFPIMDYFIHHEQIENSSKVPTKCLVSSEKKEIVIYV